MTAKLAVCAVTVLFVLSLAVLGALIYRLESERPAAVASVGAPDIATGKFTALAAPRPAPPLSFTAQSGETVTLADLRGRVVLINLWATWCAPCIAEMPSLAKLQARLGGLAILAVSEDRRGAELVDPFIAKLAIPGLAIYLDPKSEVGHAFGVEGLPTSILIDREGRVAGSLQGAADWDAGAMVELISSYIGAPPKG
ncbi:MAG TPA: TlpA disulfide reductase family protein [Stellaceae bacterium]|nr:TlpA disulfide reductase family protein [Stellaceae bacterium]